MIFTLGNASGQIVNVFMLQGDVNEYRDHLISNLNSKPGSESWASIWISNPIGKDLIIEEHNKYIYIYYFFIHSLLFYYNTHSSRVLNPTQLTFNLFSIKKKWKKMSYYRKLHARTRQIEESEWRKKTKANLFWGPRNRKWVPRHPKTIHKKLLKKLN